MRILLTNDDGINAYGIQALYKAFVEAGHIVVCVAPLSQQSGIGSAVTLHTPLRITEMHHAGFDGYAVHGTPVDCVKIALTTIVDNHGGAPDVIVSGINAGRNIGVDVLYSGTVGAAMEGARQNIPSIAISQANFSPESIDKLLPYAMHTSNLIDRIAWQTIPKQRVLNLNYPAIPMAQALGLQVCSTDTTAWADTYEKRYDTAKRPYWWLDGYVPTEQICLDCDYTYLHAGWVTLSVLNLNMNDLDAQQSLRVQL